MAFQIYKTCITIKHIFVTLNTVAILNTIITIPMHSLTCLGKKNLTSECYNVSKTTSHPMKYGVTGQ